MARVERVVKEGMILIFFVLAWLVEADDGPCVGCTRGNRCSSCRRLRMECASSVPSDRDVISRVDDSTVTQSWEISNRVRVRDREMPCKQRNSRCERYALHLYTMHTHTYTASDHSTTTPLLLLLLLLATIRKTQNSWSPHLDFFPCRGECCMHLKVTCQSIQVLVRIANAMQPS